MMNGHIKDRIDIMTKIKKSTLDFIIDRMVDIGFTGQNDTLQTAIWQSSQSVTDQLLKRIHKRIKKVRKGIMQQLKCDLKYSFYDQIGDDNYKHRVRKLEIMDNIEELLEQHVESQYIDFSATTNVH